MSLLTSISKVQKQPLMNVTDAVLPEILTLVHSPLLQGAALNAMLEFFQSLVTTQLPGVTYRELLRRLTAPICSVNGQHGQEGASHIIHKQAYHSIAKCVAALTITCPQEALPVVQQFLQELKVKRNIDSVQLFALLAIGEIGKHIDLSSISELKTVLLDSFSSQSEEVKTAASFALGSVAVGNLPEYLPFVLNEIENQPKRQYLLLHSLKEIISCQSASPASVKLLQPFIKNVWSMLFNHCECTEEGTRNVVAECLGKLTLIDPVNLLPELKSYLNSESPLARSTVVTAMKFTISDQPQPIDTLLRGCIGDFLKTLKDPDLNVRRVALVAFNSAAHNKPSLIRDLLDSILPELYNETKVRKELIREVEMGPFKHTVDDGLDIRKAAFECMYTLLDSCLDRLDIFQFLNHVEDGLRDHYDIKMLTYLMLVRLASLCPSAVLQRIERLVEPLRATCTTKVKANSVKQEFEKQDELKRSAMRAFTALLAVPDADKNPLMNEFLAQIKSTAELQILFESIQKDCSGSVSESALLMDIS
ncbi:cullin-associated NEDD8-dissociated protein 1-like [Stegodyphus dumicola]|uniref:cullin-associated NEDD8-dissociated protein 1-like n=1 Tax=Stegodyphus dumicola TaxID=202533 RepID=UPI0015A9A9B9|nr:cullin-associated NEDD8-dissociated protein 1-like [Stegodyphus dumicola]